ncbi:MAG: molecular chaperone DnaJ [Verrucomicrobiales bacterium]|nr:molecular chaperone DnaJ [Verrucomicrobiales bacterium]
MLNPWLVLNLPPDADETAIRHAWRTALQAAPPESDPVRFQAVQEAYTAIRDARSRADTAFREWKNPPDSPSAAVRALLAVPGAVKVPPAAAFHSYLQACATSSPTP